MRKGSIQRDPDRLWETSPCDSCEAEQGQVYSPHLELGQFQTWGQHEWRKNWELPQGEGLRCAVNEKLSMSHQCTSKAQKSNCILKHARRSVSGRTRFLIVLFYSTLMRLHLQCCFQLWGPQKNKDLLDWVQKVRMNIIRGLEHLSSLTKRGWDSFIYYGAFVVFLFLLCQ